MTLLSLLFACTVAESTHHERVDANALRTLDADLDRGDFHFQALDDDALSVDVRAFGFSTKDENAARNLDGTQWDLERVGSALNLRSSAAYMNSGVDWTLSGPGDLIATIDSNDDVWLDGLAGFQTVRADDITVDLVGGGDLLASGSVDATFDPVRGDTIRIEADGPVHLTLPYGAEVDLQVWGDPESEMMVEELGFHSVATDAGYFAGVVGSGTIRVDVYTDSTVTVESVW